MAMSSPFLPVRSISLPSKLTPTSPTIEEEQNKLKKSKTSLDIAEPVQTSLLSLTKSLNSMSNLIGHFPPSTNHHLTRNQHYEMVEKALDESVTLLDVCCLGKDLMCSMRGKVQVLQSAFRRKGAESIIRSHLVSYFLFRKSSSKDVSRSIRAFTKQTRNAVLFAPTFIQEANTTTMNSLQYFVLLSSSPLMKTQFGGYSTKSKIVSMSLFLSQKENEQEINEAGCVDLALYSIHRQAKKGKDFKHEVPMAQKKLELLGLYMEGLEDGLHCLYKFLIQYRVSLLNMLTH